jgi:hypothetical protein
LGLIFDCSIDYLLGQSKYRSAIDYDEKEKNKSELEKILNGMTEIDKSLFAQDMSKALEIILNKTPPIPDYSEIETNVGVWIMRSLVGLFTDLVDNAAKLYKSQNVSNDDYKWFIVSSNAFLRFTQKIVTIFTELTQQDIDETSLGNFIGDNSKPRVFVASRRDKGVSRATAVLELTAGKPENI